MRVAIKIGSNVLTRPDGTLDITRMSALVDQIAELHRAGKRNRAHFIRGSCFWPQRNSCREETGYGFCPTTLFGSRTSQINQPVL